MRFCELQYTQTNKIKQQNDYSTTSIVNGEPGSRNAIDYNGYKAYKKAARQEAAEYRAGKGKYA